MKMPCLRASSRNAASDVSASSSCDGGEQPLALDLHDVGHLGRLHVIGAGRFRFADQAHGGIEIGGGSRPERIWIIAALKVAGVLLMRCCSFACQQRIELAGMFQGMQVVAAADMHAADEYLRHRHRARRALHHGLPFGASRHIDFLEVDALAFQQSLGRMAIGAPAGGINFNGGHVRALIGYRRFTLLHSIWECARARQPGRKPARRHAPRRPGAARGRRYRRWRRRLAHRPPARSGGL